MEERINVGTCQNLGYCSWEDWGNMIIRQGLKVEII